MRRHALRIALGALGLLGVAGVAAAVGFYVYFVRDLPDFHDLDDYRPRLSTRVLARDGRPIGEFFVEKRRLAAPGDVPRHVVRAFVAGEDSTFFEHSGIDYSSILRAAWVNLRAGGEIKQGGSTITQQMVKGLLLSPERKLRRKIREMILARRIEQRFSKDEILYLYLNQIYFGHGAYGIGEAARSYFGKEVGELSVSEGALLAGLPKAPSRYSPRANPEEAEGRRRYVLERMREEGFLDEGAYAEALAERPVLADPAEYDDYEVAAYFTEEVRRTLFDALDDDLVLGGGLVVETTLDLDLQRAAVAAVRTGLVDHDHRQGYRGPLRTVAAGELEAELARVGIENGFETAAAPETARAGEEPASGEAAAARAGEEPASGEAAAAPTAREASAPRAGEAPDGAAEPGPGPWLGVVLEVLPKEERARIGLAPGRFGFVHLEDVTWAHDARDEGYPRPVKQIGSVFSVGDVARFARRATDGAGEATDGAGAGDGELRLSLEQEPLAQGALLSFELATGDVLALVGGYDFDKSEFNRVTQARRQPGSAFKPIIYGAALAHGKTPASTVSDTAVVRADATGFTWRPRNYGRKFYGEVTLRTALARSMNNATIRLFDQIGADDVIEYARRLGIASPLNRDLSLALGSSGVSLIELTRAYAVFPAGGYRVEPRFIRRVLDRDGNVLLENVPLGEPAESDVDVAAGPGDPAEPPSFEPPPDAERVIPATQAYLMTDLLRAVVVDPRGTGGRLRALRRPVGGKTGTTNEQADAWFVGFSPEIATGVWVGHDVSRYLGRGETGSRAAAPIWVDYMRVALSARPVRDFAEPEGIVRVRIDRSTGLLADATSENTLFQAFVAGTEPTEQARTVRVESELEREIWREQF